jgi:hypothetical protein
LVRSSLLKFIARELLGRLITEQRIAYQGDVDIGCNWIRLVSVDLYNTFCVIQLFNMTRPPEVELGKIKGLVKTMGLDKLLDKAESK